MARETITSLDMLRDEDARFGTKPAVPAIAKDLKALGSGTVYSYEKPDASLLETFPNPLLNGNKNWAGSINIVSPEFTSLCPKTGQPDFATIIIDYIPKDKCVESKSLKLYLGSFRMHGEFHESCVQRIASDLVELLDPQWLKVKGEFTPRGGIPFWPEVSYFAGGGDVHPAENIGSCSA